jgi:hypothetical protein
VPFGISLNGQELTTDPFFFFFIGAGMATAPEPPAAAAGKGPGLTVRERMLQLNELLDAGLVTKQEFEAKRQVILDAL